jgi:plasmid maintenance system antidote protein VapI
VDTTPRADVLREKFPPATRKADARKVGISVTHLRKFVNQGQGVSPAIAVKIAHHKNIPLSLVLNIDVPPGVVL